MKMQKLLLLSLAACVAGAAIGQDKPNTTQEQSNQQKASSSIKMRAASSARTATGVKSSPQQDAQARYERAEKVAGSVQKKTSDTASAAASNTK
ncbi:hypothetical protein [Pseudoduganella violaceinigra]|uniref:hypothetical protein n=1 Tax=Pseudoduganella violaceinigra TaxID=246602 RepID=UPI0003F62857|nr:hypothetical protein [Pseudoduganella violaceinigra]